MASASKQFVTVGDLTIKLSQLQCVQRNTFDEDDNQCTILHLSEGGRVNIYRYSIAQFNPNTLISLLNDDFITVGDITVNINQLQCVQKHARDHDSNLCTMIHLNGGTFICVYHHSITQFDVDELISKLN
jgi:hypothetical protein